MLLWAILAALLFGVWLWFLATPTRARNWVSCLDVTAPDLTASWFRETKSGTRAREERGRWSWTPQLDRTDTETTFPISPTATPTSS